MTGSATDEVRGKVVVITGASSGFGKGTAMALAPRGAHLILAARREEALNTIARECQSAGANAVPICTDVAERAHVEQLAQSAVKEFGRIDVWINDAGVGALGRFNDVPLDDHLKVIETDLLGVIFGSYFALAQFRTQGSGTLINVSSVFGKIPAPYYASYTAAKYGVVGLSASLREELRQEGIEQIHVCTVLPMATDTPFFDHASNYTGHEPAPVPPLYDPQSVIDAIVGLVEKPQAEVVVGGLGKMMVAAHSLAPRAVERFLGSKTHQEQFQKAAPAHDSAGSVRKPSPAGTGVSAGRL
jgi:short-subunit dehydrogenase